MTQTRLLIGSLSNDLYRVANLVSRNSNKAANRFAKEAKRWSVPLQNEELDEYIINIAKDVSNNKSKNVSLELAEKYLMYAILLQNYSLHNT
ncbi:hypothetical protein ACFL0F_01620 [Patescibacteria group bacterium]